MTVTNSKEKINFDKERLDLKELKSAFENPRLYLASYFEELCNQIDIKCHLFIEANPNLVNEIIEQQAEMINQVKVFETDCLNQQSKSRLSEQLSGLIRQEIKRIERDLASGSADKDKLRQMLDDALYEIQQALFSNRTLVYLEDDKIESPVFNVSPIGSIIIVEDEFISHRKFLANLSDDREKREPTKRYTAEDLRINRLKELKTQLTNPIGRVALNLKKLTKFDYLDISGSLYARYQDEFPVELKVNVFNSLKANLTSLWLHHIWIQDFPDGIFQGFTNLESIRINNCRLTHLNANLFQGLSTLKKVNLIENELVTLPSGIFEGLINLEELRLDSNKMESLPQDIFNGLVSLKNLRLYRNRLVKLDAETFRGLTNLEYLSIERNQLECIEPGMFDDLVNIVELSISFNKVTSLDKAIFKNLTEVERLCMGANQLTWLDAETFKGLGELNKIVMRSNFFVSLDPNLFQGLGKLSDLYLERNKLVSLDPNLFQGLVGLKYLHLNSNSLTNLDPGIFRGLENLTEIYLNYNYDLNRIETSVLEPLRNCRINLKHNKMDDESVSLLQEFAKTSRLSIDF